MAILRTDVERALDELRSHEEGMRFQQLAVVLGKKYWPELVARQRKKDFGLDAYAPSSRTPEGVGKGLAASITPTFKKISADAETAKENFSDLGMLLFVTSAKVGNADQKRWVEQLRSDQGLDLHIIEREEIITQMMMPENTSLCSSFLYLPSDAEPQIANLVERTRHAADVVAGDWASKTKGHPLIELSAVLLDPNGAESPTLMSLGDIDDTLSQSGRVILEGPAGRGKTTTLIQLAQRKRHTGIPLIVELPAWTSSRRGILEFIANMSAFQAERLTPVDLARVQQIEPFLLLLNGWNEIAESSSTHADDALRELERDFASAGIVVATRAHHLTPPLPGALRLRLLRLQRAQRAEYLAARLGTKGTSLRAHIEGDPSLDELTRTPFILSEVAALFEAGVEVPSTRAGVLAEVVRLHEQRGEHRNALQVAPVRDRQADYLKALATEMTRRGAVALLEAEARGVATTVARDLGQRGQIGPVEGQAVLAVLTAHHVLERVDYPHTALRFEHQQLQEYYASLDVRERLLNLVGDDDDAIDRFTTDFVNDPAWAEVIRMVAEAFADQTGDSEIDGRNTIAGRRLVAMALAVDLVFAGELARLCGAAVWSEVSSAVGKRFRAVHAIPNDNFRQYALAAMLATGADDFVDIIVPLLTGQDRQARRCTYRLWPDIHVSSLGSNWRKQVCGWSEEARADLVTEMLHRRADDDIAALAVEDESVAVKIAAIDASMWVGSDDVLTRVLESVDVQTFENVARENADRLPAAFRSRSVAAMRASIEDATAHDVRLRTALDLIRLGETGLDDVVRDALAALSKDDVRKSGPHYIEQALDHLRDTDPAWVNEWVAVRISDGVLWEYEHWVRFATPISEDLVTRLLHRIETEERGNLRLDGAVAVVAANASTGLARYVFNKLRELRHEVGAKPGEGPNPNRHAIRRLEAVFRGLPGRVAAHGILASVTSNEPLDIRVAADLVSRVGRPDVEPIHIEDEDLKARLRVYLKSSVDVVLRQDDFRGEEKAHLASSIAQIGTPEDMEDLVKLIHADIERVRRGRAARAAGDRGPLGNGCVMSYAGWNIDAVTQLDATSAEQVLVDLLLEPEYTSDAAAAMACAVMPKRKRLLDRGFRYDSMWAAREGRTRPPQDHQRRARFATALRAAIERLREKVHDERATALNDVAKALAGIDGRGSAAIVLDVMTMAGQSSQYTQIETAERLLMAGVVLPTATVFSLVDTLLERTEEWMQESDKYLLCRILALCPFVDDPRAGIVKMRRVLRDREALRYQPRELVVALGESRSDAAVALLHELASDADVFGRHEDDFIDAIAKLDTPRAREVLLGLADPDIDGFALTRTPRRDDLCVRRLAGLARRVPETGIHLRNLCERDLPEVNRQVLSRVLFWLGTPQATTASLSLIDDSKPSPIPHGTWDEIERAFVVRQPYGEIPNAFTEHARASNGLRIGLFGMAHEDPKRQKAAFMLLGQIEAWRLEHGRPTGEPRHPDLASGRSWPPET